MTTGRINQVTIFDDTAPKRGSELVGGRGDESPGERLLSGREPINSPTCHPIATIEFLKVESVKELTGGPIKL